MSISPVIKTSIHVNQSSIFENNIIDAPYRIAPRALSYRPIRPIACAHTPYCICLFALLYLPIRPIVSAYSPYCICPHALSHPPTRPIASAHTPACICPSALSHIKNGRPHPRCNQPSFLILHSSLLTLHSSLLISGSAAPLRVLCLL